MSKKDVIKKALISNDVCENDVAVVTTERHHYIIHIFEMIVLLLYQLALITNISSDDILNFIMIRFEAILDIILIEIEISILKFDNIYEEGQKIDAIELHNRDECLLVVAIQDEVNKKLKEII